MFSDSKKTVVSSAICVNLISLDLPILIPLILLLFLMFSAMISAAIIKSRAEIGQPCRIPRDISKLLDTHPFFIILFLGCL